METDKCVSCDEDTGVRKDMPVDVRLFYVEGAGQLCKKCWNKIYGEKT